jgi:hypothetical protein
MKLTTVLASVNNNNAYYSFIPKQILFWKKFNIKFIAVFVGKYIPNELEPYRENIILWSRNTELHTAFVAQNLRMYYPSLINLPDDELLMITDMDMLPMNHTYYTTDLQEYGIDDFIYYRYIDKDQIYMCYNAAHPKTWSKVFNIHSEEDIEKVINDTFNISYNGIPGSSGWFIDQKIMYSKLINYPNLKVLNRPIKRLEMWTYSSHLNNNDKNFIHRYDDAHFHRNYFNNIEFIIDAEKQLINNK